MIDNILTVIFSWELPSLFLLLYAVSCLFAVLRSLCFCRLGNLVRRQKELRQKVQSNPTVSIVLTAYSDSSLLQQRLPMYLKQEYACFELIVVGMETFDAASERLLAEMQHAYPLLRYFVIPQHGRDISRQSLALSLGLRSAQYEWVLFSDISCMPQSRHWIACMAAHCHTGKDVVSGITLYDKACSLIGRQFRFANLWYGMLQYAWAGKHKLLYARPTNLLYRRSFFLAHGGLNVSGGQREGCMELTINRYCHKHNSSVCLVPETVMLQDLPLGYAALRTESLMRYHIFRQLRQGWWLSLRSGFHGFLTWIHSLVFLSALVIMLLHPSLPLDRLIVLLLLWLMHFVIRDLSFNYSLRLLSAPTMHVSLPFYLHGVVLYYFSTRLRYSFSNKKQYRKNYI